MFSDELIQLATTLLADARARRLTIATAESCTGGLIAALLTEIPGSSDVVERGFVTYSNEAKMDLLGVPQDVLVDYGAVSAATARAMAAGALVNSRADLVVSVTGVAGPGGGTAEKPVGLVHLAAARASAGQGERSEAVRPRDHEKSSRMIHRECRFGDIGRDQVRLKSVKTALEMILQLME